MQVTIIKQDNLVIVDGQAYWVNCSKLAKDISVLQWNTEAKVGHVEYFNRVGLPFKHNDELASFNQYQYLIDEWDKAEEEAAVRAKIDSEAKQHAADSIKTRPIPKPVVVKEKADK